MANRSPRQAVTLCGVPRMIRQSTPGLAKLGKPRRRSTPPCPTPEEEDVAIALILVYVFVSGLVMVKLDGVKVHKTEVLLAITKYLGRWQHDLS